MQYFEKMLDKPVGRTAFCSFFSNSGSGVPKLAVVLLSLASPHLPTTYASSTLRKVLKKVPIVGPITMGYDEGLKTLVNGTYKYMYIIYMYIVHIRLFLNIYIYLKFFGFKGVIFLLRISFLLLR